MKIAIDLDEVLADLLTQYISFLNESQNYSLSRKQFTGYYIWDTWDKTEEEKIKLLNRVWERNESWHTSK